jgi:hypothetical protein
LAVAWADAADSADAATAESGGPGAAGFASSEPGDSVRVAAAFGFARVLFGRLRPLTGDALHSMLRKKHA